MTSGLGWPPVETPQSTQLGPTPGGTVGLGWPSEPEPAPAATAGAPGDEALRRIRAAVAAVSRETDPPTGVRSADAPPAEKPVSRETAVAEGLTALLPGRRRVITVANQKGGVGKTTSAVNLAVALAQQGARVLVLDLDPQGNASTGLAVEHQVGVPSTYEVLVEDKPLREVVVPVPGVPRLQCAPATIDLAGAEIELVSVVARESRLRRALQAYDDEVDYVFIDCPPSLGLLTVNALVAGEEVLIPIQCEYYALEGLGQLLSTIDLIRSHLNDRLHASAILLTMFDARTRLSEQVADEVRRHFENLVLRSVVPRSVRISEAPGYGQSVVTYDPGSRGAQSYLQAARELAARRSEE